jgi:putative protease
LQLQQVYSRGLGPHFLVGTNHQAVVQGRAPRHRGVLVGQVTHVGADRVTLRPNPATAIAPLKAGDGVVFDAADWRSPEEPEEGGRIYAVTPVRGGQVELQFGNGAVNFARIRPGDLLWRTDDPALEKVVRPWTQASTPVHKQPVAVRVIAHTGAPLTMHWQLVERPEVQVTVQTPEPLSAAQQQPLDQTLLWAQLSRLGNTAYELHTLELDRQGEPFAPASLLNQLRRQAVEQLAERQRRRAPITLHDPIEVLEDLLADSADRPAPLASHHAPPQLHLLVRTPEQLAAAVALQPASITLDYLDLYGLRPAVETVQTSGIVARVASPRVLKPDEQRVVNFLLRLDCPILVRSTGLLHALQRDVRPPLIGDFSLNAANVLTATTLLGLGLERLTPTHDLNAQQVTELAGALGGAMLEVVAYQHLPVFHTEHCVFCRFLSTGTSYKDCGHPCEHHRVAVRDPNGRAHPVMADVGCRNTVFGAEAQEASKHLSTWLDAGIRHYRLEFVHESGEQVSEITRAFAATLAGRQSTQTLGRQLQRLAPQGATEGSLFTPEIKLIALQA